MNNLKIYFQYAKTIIQLSNIFTEIANEESFNICLCYFTFIIFVNVNKNINEYSYQNYTYSSNVITGYQRIQEYGKSQQKHFIIPFYYIYWVNTG